MADLKENQMMRSTSQALYKYVPKRWIDFYFSSNRRGYTAFVDGWSSIPLEDVNKKRLLRKVSDAVKSYQRQCGSRIESGETRCTKDFSNDISPDTYTVLTPRVSEKDRAIAGYISPSVFFCEKCHQIRRFKRESQYSYIMDKKCMKPGCGGNLVQLRDIYYCRCGWAGEVSIGDCDYHKGQPLIMRIKDHKYASAPNGNPVVLVGFPDESPEKKTVYATRLKTEGVLFEIDRIKILHWLVKNNIIEATELPVNLNDETEVKAWFVNNVNSSLIEPFSLLDKVEDPITYYVYRLVHTISHSLIISAAEICGLDKNSLSEYIFPSIPATFIYCQNTQGFNMGALFSIFEMYFDKWLDTASNVASECIFDPICVEHEAACAGCVFTNEISCQHFNHDLDRTILIGKYDKEEDKRFWGFWEE